MEKDLEFEGKHGGIYRSIWRERGRNFIKIQSQNKKGKKKKENSSQSTLLFMF